MITPKSVTTLLPILLLASISFASPESWAQTLEGKQGHKRLFKRQTTLSSEEAGIEVESTSSPSSPSQPPRTTTTDQLEQGHQGHNHGHHQHPLASPYPDLPLQPNFVPAFGQRDGSQGFVRLNPFADRQPPRSMGGIPDRLQVESFRNGLGRRLLSMVGLSSGNGSAEISGESRSGNPISDVSKALQNSTVLSQLNQGVHSVYGGISRMYNTTVRQQLDMMRQRFAAVSANNTDPWQKRMAQQVPQFFNSIAMRVNEAQENLNRAWRQMVEAKNNTNGLLSSRIDLRPNARSANILESSFNLSPDDVPQFGPDPELEVDQLGAGRLPMGGSFFDNIGRSFGLGSSRGINEGQFGGGSGQNLMAQMLDFWRNQIMPQIGMLQSQMSRIWRDLSQSGALRPMDSLRMRNQQASITNVSAKIMDEVLKDVEPTELEQEFKLIDRSLGGSGQQASSPVADEAPTRIGSRMHDRLAAMQRELNHLWMSLSSSIQNAMSSFGKPRRGAASGTDPAANKLETVDPAENEINDKIKDLSKLQRDADIVHDTIKRQQMIKDQQQRQAQQQQQPRQANFADRVRDFFSNPEMSNHVGRFRNSLGATYNQLESAVGDLWSGIPERWENFMRPQDITSLGQDARLLARPTARANGPSSAPRSSLLTPIV